MSVKRGLGRQHTTFISCKNAACSNEGFKVGQSKYDFCRSFQIERLRYTNLFPVVIVSSRHDLPSDVSSSFFDRF